ncbi:MAG: metallophosphoesterase [Candidatus Methanomethylophilaceae archaeon]|nr:metallophosphoesterase [Candidatus Methanomethylophilaceae archaeon]MBR4201966.1 metallophosphoesterase [Candidatus Methanomethylophilaceae archaeon]
MIPQPVYGIPALKAGNALIICDLHIGVESHLRSKGFHLTSHTNDMRQAILDSADEDINKLIVLGDVKDSVPGSTKQEYAEIPDFFESLFERFDTIDVVRGNHDTMIEEFLPPRVRIRPATGMKFDDLGLIHGHTWPSQDVMDCETLILGHNHPAVMFRDGVGRQMTEPCWFRGNFAKDENDKYQKLPKNFIVIPAFNRMLGGSPINVIGEDLLGPVLNSDLLDLDNGSIYLLDGICLGKRSGNMLKGKENNRFKQSSRTKSD